MNKIIWVKTKCLNYYHFINKLKYLNISILEINYEKKWLYLKIYAADFKKLTKYLVSYNFKLVKNNGIYYIIDLIKKNWILVVGLILGLGLYLLLTHLIVRLDIIHENKEIREILSEELKERGVKVPSIKKNYKQLTKIKEEILELYPDRLDWLEIEVRGMTYIIRVEQRVRLDNNFQNKFCDIVAKKNGRVTNIKLANGELLVGIDDYVRKGDLLISGNVIYNAEEKRNTCANGEVKAEVWYKVNVTIPFNYYQKVKTGRKKNNLVIDNDGNKKRLLKKRFASFDSSYKLIFKILGIKLFLEKEYETKKIAKVYNEHEALQIALNKAEENIKKKIGQDQIINKKVLKKDINDSTMEVEIFITTEEVISRKIIKGVE